MIKCNRVISLLLVLVMIFPLIPIHSASAATKSMRIEWFDVGSGDSIYIKLPNGKTVLVDGGATSKGTGVVKQLKKLKVSTIDYCISTHRSADHIGGLQSIFKTLNVKRFYYPDDISYNTKVAKAVLKLAKKEKDCKIYNPDRGDKIKGGDGAVLEFVHSNKNYYSNKQDSLALYVNYGKLEVLFCGGNMKGSQEAIKKRNVDILQLPNHGSEHATTSKFLKRFDPEYVVVSTDGKKFGYPHAATFNCCKSYDKKIKVYRTDKKGDIVLTATKKSWKFTTSGVKISKYCNEYGFELDDFVPAGYGCGTTATGKKYHMHPDCSKISKSKHMYWTYIEEAKDEGYTPCVLCLMEPIKQKTSAVGIYQHEYLDDGSTVTESLRFYSNGKFRHDCSANEEAVYGFWYQQGNKIEFNLLGHVYKATITKTGIMWGSSFLKRID